MLVTNREDATVAVGKQQENGGLARLRVVAGWSRIPRLLGTEREIGESEVVRWPDQRRYATDH